MRSRKVHTSARKESALVYVETVAHLVHLRARHVSGGPQACENLVCCLVALLCIGEDEASESRYQRAQVRP
jgi:hypothetical protein